MKKILLILFLILASFPAYAARGFNSTFGTGSTDIVTTNYSTLTNGQRSYSVWVWGTSSSATNIGRIWDVNIVAAAADTFYFTSGGTLQYIRLFSTAGQWDWTPPSLNAWHHFLLTYDAGSTSNVPQLYIDGTAVSTTSTVQPTGTINTTSMVYTIGNRATTLNRNVSGKIAEFSMWSGILTANEAKSLAQGASPLNIRNGSLLYYAPLYGTETAEPDWSAGHIAATVSGALFQPHPPIQPSPLSPTGQ